MRQRIAYWSVVLIAITTTFAIASTGSVKTISGCVDKKTGGLRISSKCLKTETQLTWNQEGIQGEVGPQGIAGLNGIDGLIGSQGTQGLQGLQGLQGIQGTQGAPGKDGVNGAMGPQGPTGASGPQGVAGSSSGGGGLLVRDVNNNLVGYLVDFLSNSATYVDTSSVSVGFGQPTVAFTVWVPRINNVIKLYLDGSIVEDAFFAYESRDCTGTPYTTPQPSIAGNVGLRALRSEEGSVSWWKPAGYVTAPANPGLITLYSINYGSGCRGYGAGAQRWLAWQPATNPLAGFTINGPLHISVS